MAKRVGALRAATSVAVRSPPVSEKAKPRPLHRRLSEGSAAEALDLWSAEGGAVTAPHLMKHVRALCKFRRHNQALEFMVKALILREENSAKNLLPSVRIPQLVLLEEISMLFLLLLKEKGEVMDWMGKKGLEMSNGNHAFRVDLLSKVEGINSAENFFLKLPDLAKDQRTYGALLYCYCKNRMLNNAISLFEKMKELNLASNTSVYNNLMSLYRKLSQHEKVPGLFEEMKEKNISPDNCSYRILMKSYSSMNDLKSVERAMQDFEASAVPLDWFTYCSLAEIYNSASLFEKAEIALKKAELVMNDRDFSPFVYLIRLYAEAGNFTEVKKVWKLLKARSLRPNNDQYLVMLRALRDSDDMEAMKQCFKEWECGCVNYDARMVNVMIQAYEGKNMVKEAESLREKAADKCG